jgi:hypothetical protein
VKPKFKAGDKVRFLGRRLIVGVWSDEEEDYVGGWNPKTKEYECTTQLGNKNVIWYCQEKYVKGIDDE